MSTESEISRSYLKEMGFKNTDDVVAFKFSSIVVDRKTRRVLQARSGRGELITT